MEQRDHERSFYPLYSLQIIDRIDIERDKEQAGKVPPQDTRRCRLYLNRSLHIKPQDLQRYQQSCDHSGESDPYSCITSKIPRLPYTPPLSGAHIFRNDRLRSISYPITESLDQGKQISGHTVYGKPITAEITHDLVIEQDNENAHPD